MLDITSTSPQRREKSAKPSRFEATGTPPAIKQEIARLKALARVIERSLENVDCNDVFGDLTAGEVGDLAGLLHARLAALDAAVWNT